MDGLWHATPSRPPPPSPSSTAPAYKTPGSLAAKAAALNGAPRTESRAAIPAACGDVAGSRKESRLGGSGAEGEPPQELPPLTNAAGVAASISSSLVMVSFDIPHLVRRKETCWLSTLRKRNGARENTRPCWVDRSIAWFLTLSALWVGLVLIAGTPEEDARQGIQNVL